jgi:mono/diheme cytochrome c family protein
VYAKCQQCHPINYVVESAGLPDFLWEDTLSLMKQLGMHVTEQEEKKLYEYLTTYLGTEPPPQSPADAGDEAEVDGDAVYAGSCAVCHGPGGQGGSDAFPPLSGHAASLAAADRDYLPLVVLYGLSGEIGVNGETYNGVMPAWSRLSDEEIAAVLNKVTLDWDTEGTLNGARFEPYTADGIAEARGLGLSATEVHERRPAEP